MDKLQDKRRAGWFWDSNTIFDSGLSAYAILVRLYLARCADSDGVSFPAIATIANKCNISRASVVRALKELEAKGWLCREPRIIPGTKAKATTIYTLITPSEEAASTSETADLGSHRTEGRFSQSLGSAHTEPRVGSHRTREGLPIEGLPNKGLPIEGHMCASEPEQQDKYTAEFESFWQEYPRKKEKKRAYRAWKAALNKKAEPQQLITAAKHYFYHTTTERTDQKYIKHPSTFLGPDEPWREWLEPPKIGGGKSGKYDPTAVDWEAEAAKYLS